MLSELARGARLQSACGFGVLAFGVVFGAGGVVTLLFAPVENARWHRHQMSAAAGFPAGAAPDPPQSERSAGASRRGGGNAGSQGIAATRLAHIHAHMPPAVGVLPAAPGGAMPEWRAV